MNESLPTPGSVPPALRVAAGEDRFGEHRGLGISFIDFKVSTQDSSGLEGEFIVEVGQDRIRLQSGDSLFAPRKVPHVWAHVGDTRGRILIAFTPAGKMDAFFREVTKANAMPLHDARLWRAHGMELLGPPLSVE